MAMNIRARGSIGGLGSGGALLATAGWPESRSPAGSDRCSEVLATGTRQPSPARPQRSGDELLVGVDAEPVPMRLDLGPERRGVADELDVLIDGRPGHLAGRKCKSAHDGHGYGMGTGLTSTDPYRVPASRA